MHGGANTNIYLALAPQTFTLPFTLQDMQSHIVMKFLKCCEYVNLCSIGYYGAKSFIQYVDTHEVSEVLWVYLCM